MPVEEDRLPQQMTLTLDLAHDLCLLFQALMNHDDKSCHTYPVYRGALCAFKPVGEESDLNGDLKEDLFANYQ